MAFTSKAPINFSQQKRILQEVEYNSKILDHVKQDLYLHDNILEDLDKLEKYPKESKEYQDISKSYQCRRISI